MQLIVPTSIRKELFALAQSEITKGHMGVRKMLARIRRRYVWPAMGTDIRQWILGCDACSSRRMDRLKKLKRVKHQVGAPMEKVAMNIMGPLPRTSKGNKYVLVVADYYTK